MDMQKYQKALARAKSDGCRIIGTATIDGGRSWIVENPAHDGAYVVRLAAGAKELTCNCPARVPCKHRALVTESLLREVEAARDPWSRNGQRVTVGQMRMARDAGQATLWR